MIVDLNDAPGANLSFDCEVSPDLEEEAARIAEPLKASGIILRTGPKVVVEGRVNGFVDCDCVRCLRSMRLPVDLSFREVFVPAELFDNESESQIAGEDMDASLLSDDVLDISEIVREQVLLFLPEQIFCEPGCRGLCPDCGANLNDSECGCGREEIDPRWSALKDIK